MHIYIHTIHIQYTFIYIHIQLLPPPPPPPTTTHTTHTTGGRGVLIHSYTYIYNFFHHHHPPPPPTTTHHHPHHPHHPHHRGGGGYWCATIQTHNHGVGGGGRYLAMLAHIYTYVRTVFNLPTSNQGYCIWGELFEAEDVRSYQSRWPQEMQDAV